jgi:hypothetical protein
MEATVVQSRMHEIVLHLYRNHRPSGLQRISAIPYFGGCSRKRQNSDAHYGECSGRGID